MTPEEVPEGPLLVDTDAFSALLYRNKPEHPEYTALVAGHVLALAFPTVGELLSGALERKWGDARVRVLRERIGQTVVLRSTDEVIDWYGQIRSRFRDQLKKGGENDMWIAACALAQPTRPPIVTGNLSDFLRIGSEFPIVLVNPSL